MKSIGLLVFLSLLTFEVFAQSTDNTGIEIRPKYGFLLPHRAIMTHLVQGHAPAIEIAYIKQTSGHQEWASKYALPRYGLSAFFSDFGNPEVLGTGFGSFGFIEIPMLRRSSWMLGGKLTAGLSYITKTFDQQQNPKNNAIGSHLNSLVIAGLVINKQFRQSEVSLGIDMTHMSNGATVLPNLGLNIPYLSVGYTRYLKALEFHSIDTTKADYQFEKNRFYSSLNLSSKQIYPTGGRNYFVGSVFTFFHHQFTRKAAIDVGVDIIFNASHKDEADFEATFSDVTQVGFFAGYVLPVNAFEYVLGMGYYMRNPINPDGPLYHRFGFRYKVNERIKLNLSIKSHWGKADYFEYGIVYRWH
jgi:hypothetical protein